MRTPRPTTVGAGHTLHVDRTLTHIQAGVDAQGTGFGAVVERWELIRALAMRSIRSRFRETKLGIVWAVVQPLVYMLVLNLFFSVITRFDTGTVPYPLHLLTGLVAFQTFTKSLNEGAASLSGNQPILSNIYIPPVVFPVAAMLSGLVDSAFSVGLLVVFLVGYGVGVSANLVYLPVILCALLVLYASVHLLMSVLCFRFKDVAMLAPVVTQLMFFGTPIFYPSTAIPEPYRALYGLNPMAGIVEALRWSILGKAEAPEPGMLLASGLSTAVIFVLAVVVFRSLAGRIYSYV